VSARDPDQIWEEGLDEGERRLHRGPLALAATAFAGGVDVFFSILLLAVVSGGLHEVMPEQAAHVLASLVFGVGFAFITLGRAELFTENFLIPVGAVLERRRPLGLLPRLWLPTLIANLLGMFVIALMLSSRTVLDHDAVVAAGHTANVFAERSLGAAFISAIIAGMVMTLWTWLGIAVRTDIGRILVALAIGFTIAAPNLNHVIVGTGEMMFGVLGGASRATWGDVGINFVIALAGNIVGGTLFVTLTRFVQARAAQ
jgi:formate/nitrite transporter FocA (FNT family)